MADVLQVGKVCTRICALPCTAVYRFTLLGQSSHGEGPALTSVIQGTSLLLLQAFPLTLPPVTLALNQSLQWLSALSKAVLKGLCHCYAKNPPAAYW